MTSAEILTAVNNITGRSETSVETELLEVLLEISRRAACLQETETGNTVADQNYIDSPDDAVVINHIDINDEPYYPVNFDEFKNGSKTGFWEWEDRLYLYPTPESALEYTIYYRKKHPASVDTILLDDEYKPAVKAFVASKIFAKYGIKDNGDGDGSINQEALYERELAKVIDASHPPQTFIVRGKARP